MAKMLVHPVSGDRLVILDGSDGETFRFEILTNVAVAPPEDHAHREQEERVEVVAGSLRCRVAGREHVLRAGDAITIPSGTPHAVWNADPGETRAIGEFRPALDMQERFEAYFRGTEAVRGKVRDLAAPPLLD